MTPNKEEIVLEELSSGILRLTLNDEKRRNALSENMLDLLYAKMMAAAENSRVRVIILAAKGRVFCAGHDLKEITQARNSEDEGITYFKNLFDKCSEVMKAIVTNPKPVIAEVDGTATAAGCQIVAIAVARLFLICQVTDEPITGSSIRRVSVPAIMLLAVLAMSTFGFALTGLMMALALIIPAQHGRLSGTVAATLTLGVAGIILIFTFGFSEILSVPLPPGQLF